MSNKSINGRTKTSLPTPGANNNILTSTVAAWTSQTPKLPNPGSTNNILKSNGTSWTSAAPSGTPTTDLAAPGANRNLLQSNGTVWASVAPELPLAGSTNNRLISNGSAWFEGPKMIGRTILMDGTNVEQILSNSAEEFWSIDVASTSPLGNFTLPNVTTLTIGRQFQFTNNNSGYTYILKSNDGTTISTLDPNTITVASVIHSTANNASGWSIHKSLPVPGTSGKLLTSDGTKWISSNPPTELPSASASGQVLTADGTNWVSQPSSTELPTPGPNDNRLGSNGSSWVQGPKTSGTMFLATGSTTTLTAAASQEFWYINTETDSHTLVLPNVTTLTIGRQFKFQNYKTGEFTSKPVTIKDHELTVIATLYDGETGIFTCHNIVYNVVGWGIEKTFKFPPPTSTGQVLTADGTTWVSQALPGSELPPATSTGQVLTANGTNWVSSAVPVELPSATSTGQVLTANGTNWVSQAVALLPTPPADTLDVFLKSNGLGSWLPVQKKQTSFGTFNFVFTLDGPEYFHLTNISGGRNIYLPDVTIENAYIGKEFTLFWDGTNNVTHPVSIYTGVTDLKVTTIQAKETIKFTSLGTSNTVANWKIERTNQYALPPPTTLNNILRSDGSSWVSTADLTTYDMSSVVQAQNEYIMNNTSPQLTICKNIVDMNTVYLPDVATLHIGRQFKIHWNGSRTANGTNPNLQYVFFIRGYTGGFITFNRGNESITLTCISSSDNTATGWILERTGDSVIPLIDTIDQTSIGIPFDFKFRILSTTPMNGPPSTTQFGRYTRTLFQNQLNYTFQRLQCSFKILQDNLTGITSLNSAKDQWYFKLPSFKIPTETIGQAVEIYSYQNNDPTNVKVNLARIDLYLDDPYLIVDKASQSVGESAGFNYIPTMFFANFTYISSTSQDI